MPLAAILGPQRRSMVSSIPSHERTSGDERSHEQSEQDEAGAAATPNRSVQHAMVDLEVRFLAQSHHQQRAADGSLSRSQNSSQHEHLRTPPNAIEKQWSEC